MSNLTEACLRLNRMAHTLGARTFGVDLGVMESGDRLIFIDGTGEPVMHDGEDLIAATPEEIDSTGFGEFPARALRAAGLAKYLEIELSRTP